MDYSHQVLDALKGKTRLLYSKLSSASTQQLRDAAAELALYVQRSQKFDFSQLRFEYDEALLYTAAAANENGLLPLPFECCFFNLGNRGLGNGEILCCVLLEHETGIAVHGVLKKNDVWQLLPQKCIIMKGKPSSEIMNVDVLSQDDNYEPSDNDCRIAQLMGQLVISRLAILLSRNIISENVKAPQKLNASRAKKGKSPLSDHTIVTIDTSTVEYERGNGSHASPRLHWRRGHVRILPSGAKTLVRPCLVGDAARGEVQHQYVMKA